MLRRISLASIAFFCTLFLTPIFSWSQTQTNSNKTNEIDPSKPSNLYSSINFSGEWQKLSGNVNTYGTRISASYAISEKNLLQVELPLMYNDQSKKFGIGDIRARYFGLLLKDDSKTINSFGGSIDIFAPTGSMQNGLGTGSWMIAPGIIAGITVSPKILLYPILSYVHVTKPDIAGASATNGGSFEIISVFDLGAASWIQITPKYAINDFKNNGNSNLNFRFDWGKMIKDDLSIGAEVFFEVKNKSGLQQTFQISIAKFFH